MSKFTNSLYESNKTEIGSRTSFEFGAKNSGVFNILESLQSKLKLKEGELIQLQVKLIFIMLNNSSINNNFFIQREIKDLERIRESMAKEMVNLSNKLENMQDKLKEYPQLEEKYKVI